MSRFRYLLQMNQFPDTCSHSFSINGAKTVDQKKKPKKTRNKEPVGSRRVTKNKQTIFECFRKQTWNVR